VTITLDVILNTVKESNPLTEDPSPEEFTVAPLSEIIGMDMLGRLQKEKWVRWSGSKVTTYSSKPP
jgi:hypothetical protein